MKHLLFLFTFSIFLVVNNFASNGNYTIGARAAGMGNISSVTSGFWSVQNNQAGLTNYKNIAAGIYYENRFMLKALGLKAVGVVLPTSSGVFGLSFSNFGYSLYNENKIGLAYAKSFGEKISAGVQLNYLYTHLDDEYKDKGLITFEAGIQTKLTDFICIGVHVFNPVNVKIDNYNNERIPAVFKLGISYLLSKNILCLLEVEKVTAQNPNIKAGLEYKILKKAYVRMGFMSDPATFTFGFGLQIQKLRFDMASSYHQVLGFSPKTSLIYDLGF
ncbi:MAG: hypothetical protein K8R41_05585 [Bacteroidales bacterium]|nr:hypothetical protein [Bacteroidales bacterium]